MTTNQFDIEHIRDESEYDDDEDRMIEREGEEEELKLKDMQQLLDYCETILGRQESINDRLADLEKNVVTNRKNIRKQSSRVADLEEASSSDNNRNLKRRIDKLEKANRTMAVTFGLDIG